MIYEYAGFHYDMEMKDGKAVWAHPQEGQHRAATKDRHRRAAVESFNQEKKLK